MAWIAGAGAIAGGLLGSKGSTSAADTQAQAADRASQNQLQMYNQTRTDQAPGRYVGGQALNSLAAAMGLQGYADSGGNALGRNPGWGGAGGGLGGPLGRGMDRGGHAMGALGGGGNALFPGQQPGSLGGFQTNPGYGFVRSEGLRGVEQTAAARGGAFGGNALRGLADYNSGLASQEYGNWWNRMAGLAGIGQTATANLSAMGGQYANMMGNSTMAAGDARASGILGQYNSIGNGINSGMNNYMMYRYLNGSGAGGNSLGSIDTSWANKYRI